MLNAFWHFHFAYVNEMSIPSARSVRTKKQSRFPKSLGTTYVLSFFVVWVDSINQHVICACSVKIEPAPHLAFCALSFM